MLSSLRGLEARASTNANPVYSRYEPGCAQAPERAPDSATRLMCGAHVRTSARPNKAAALPGGVSASPLAADKPASAPSAYEVACRGHVRGRPRRFLAVERRVRLDSMMTEAREAVFEKAVADSATAQLLERVAARHFEGALGLAAALHETGQRDRYRSLLECAIDHAQRALAAAEEERSALQKTALVTKEERVAATIMGARSTLAEAHAAKADDALHGAGQLSLSAQRAPTCAACDEGWRRVEAIVAGAEESARVAAMNALELDVYAPRSAIARTARTAARNAEAAARAARRIVEERNHAYTFHTDSGFSFGEGWYLAAAAVLAGVAIQIEPGKSGTAQAERFLYDAGLRSQCQAYRSRPRAMKHTTEIVGRAFGADPASAQRRLRAAFLGDEPIPKSVRDWVDRRLPEAHAGKSGRRKVLLWIRDGVHHPRRNTRVAELVALTRRVEQAGLVPIWTGDAVGGGRVPEGAVDMILFWRDSVFRQADMRRAQLQFFEYLKDPHGLVGQVGVTTAGMDGPALMGLPTIYLTDAPNVRMRKWVGAVPGYQEVIRESGYVERVTRVLSDWAVCA